MEMREKLVHVGVRSHTEQQSLDPLVVACMPSIVDETPTPEAQRLHPGPRRHKHQILGTVHIERKASYDRVLGVLQRNDVMDLHKPTKAKAYPRSSEGLFSQVHFQPCVFPFFLSPPAVSNYEAHSSEYSHTIFF